jgi:hypothetical protein
LDHVGISQEARAARPVRERLPRAWLLGRGYSAAVVIRSLIALGHLGRWMEREAGARLISSPPRL